MFIEDTIQPYRLYLLYKSMMYAQRHNIMTEQSLLDSARFWWYSGYETTESRF